MGEARSILISHCPSRLVRDDFFFRWRYVLGSLFPFRKLIEVGQMYD